MRRLMMASVAILSLIPATAFAADAPPPSARAESCIPPSLDDSGWDGLGVLKGGKGYAPTPMGQVHYRLMGPEKGPVVLLIHQTPWSMIEFADIQPCLAARGMRSLAVDTPGYGMSDAPDGKPSMQAYADNIVPVLDYLKIRKVIVAGHHTGAAIAAALAARHADRVTAVVLHGAPNYNDAERAQRLALPHPDLTLKPDGSHLSNYYAKLYPRAGRISAQPGDDQLVDAEHLHGRRVPMSRTMPCTTTTWHRIFSASQCRSWSCPMAPMRSTRSISAPAA